MKNVNKEQNQIRHTYNRITITADLITDNKKALSDIFRGGFVVCTFTMSLLCSFIIADFIED